MNGHTQLDLQHRLSLIILSAKWVHPLNRSLITRYFACAYVRALGCCEGMSSAFVAVGGGGGGGGRGIRSRNHVGMKGEEHTVRMLI